MGTESDSTVTVRLYGGLDWFASDADRRGQIEVAFGTPRSVKDLIESVGVPHVEVGRIVVDGRAVDFAHLVRAGDRVAVYPSMTSMDDERLVVALAEPVRFVADVHLGTLARRLRTLGFDTIWERDLDDHELAQIAQDDHRILLTRDRGLLMRRVVVHGYCPRSDDPDRQVEEVVARYGLAEQAAPFTRCVSCNSELSPVAKEEVLDELPPRTRLEHEQFVRCDGCGQVYWPGSHHAAMSSWVDDVL